MQKECQNLFAHEAWKTTPLNQVSAAWYQREFLVPPHWAGRQITVSFSYLNSYAAVYLNGSRVGETRFPGGEVDISKSCHLGGTNVLSVLVVAMPLKGVRLSYTDSASAREVKGSVPMRGLCGDVFLVSVPLGPRIANARTFTSTRKQECAFNASFLGLDDNSKYRLKFKVSTGSTDATEFLSPEFVKNKLGDEGISFTEKWMPQSLWDTHTPQNTFTFQAALLDSTGKILDEGWKQRFGFREFWINGRDFYLNGTRIFLSAVPLDNAQVNAATASYDAAKESLERLKSFGINFVYTHNYDCEPGSHLSFEEILRAADDTGMLVALSQPHFSHYDWRAPNAEQGNGYAQHAEYYARIAQDHPSVVFYAMSHNATGYSGDMDPDLIDGIHAPRDSWAQNNAKQAVRAEAIVTRLDPSRIVYHHASGNLGSMHPINFYPNFVPIQELSDWFEHWSTQGVKPAFMCEYGAPFTWDWTMYRGWYKGTREFGSANVPWEFCMAEWNSQFFGDAAFKISEAEKENLRWEAQQFRAGKLWHRWDYPNPVGSTQFDERYPVLARYLTDNWRAFRTWEVSAISPWEYGAYWKLRNGVDRRRRNLPVDWDQLQRPGYSADYLDQRYERFDMAFERADWLPTPAAQSLLRNNLSALAYLAGKAGKFTSKSHVFLGGESVEKQIIIINNSRQELSGEYHWSLELPTPLTGNGHVQVATGSQERIPLKASLPLELPKGSYSLNLSVRFNNGSTQQDKLAIEVLENPRTALPASRIALFDPKGETSRSLQMLGVRTDSVELNADLAPYDILVVGKFALTPDGPAPDISRVRDGLKVLVFEQSSAVLEKRFGFRIQEYGLREVFLRQTGHPALTGLRTEALRDWRGEATLLPPRLTYEMRPMHGPTIQWCGIPVTRVWRCGNRGNVASVLIEKPTRGDFLPLVDGGFSLQYSPLLEYREGKGLVVFCQMDVTGRTESEPAAETLKRNLLEYLARWSPSPRRELVYAGEPQGAKYFESLGLKPSVYSSQVPSANHVLVLGPGAAPNAIARNGVEEWLKSNGYLLALGLNDGDARALLPFRVAFKQAEHISCAFPPFPWNSLLAGVGAADVHSREPQNLPLLSGEVEFYGDGVLAKGKGNVVFCQLKPWLFEGMSQSNLRRTQRRAAFLVSRLLANLGVAPPTPLLDRFHSPKGWSEKEARWLTGFYLDRPEEWDDPYRFFRW